MTIPDATVQRLLEVIQNVLDLRTGSGVLLPCQDQKRALRDLHSIKEELEEKATIN